MTAEKSAYHAQLALSHRVWIRVSIHDRNEQFIEWLDLPVIDGQVDVDTEQVPERKLSIVVADPDEVLDFGRVWADNFIRVEYGIHVASLAKRVWHPVFFGPFTKIGRDHGRVTLEAASKEVLLQDPVVWGKFIKNAANVTGGDAVVCRTLRVGNTGHNEVQEIQALATVNSGTFRVKFGDDTSTPIQWNTSAASAETILIAMNSIPAGGVVVTGGPLPNNPLKVTFTGGLANADQSLLEIIDGTGNLDDDVRYAAKLLRVLLRTTGERKYAFGNFANRKLPKNFKIPKDASVWEIVNQIVDSVNQQSNIHWRPYYDGAGVLRVENMDNGFKFTEDFVMNRPTRDYSLDDFRNTTIVFMTRGKETQPVKPVVTSLQKRHPLSPWKLARNSKKRYIVERIDNANIRTRAQATKLGKSKLKHLSSEKVEVSFDSIPVPILVPGTRCTISIDGYVQRFPLKAYSLGLRPNTMSIGYIRRMRTRTKRPIHAY